MTLQARPTRFFERRTFRYLAIAFAWVSAWAVVQAADYTDKPVEFQFKSGLDRANFAKAFKELNDQGYRIVDIESYRSGRSTTVSTIWNKLKEGDGWQIAMSLPVAEFVDTHNKHLEAGYSLVEFEVDRNGATLHFSGIWRLTEGGIDTEFYLGMESLDFSNRYGEMADRGYRLIDFEAYGANGKYRHAGLWLKNDGKEVRFYRAISKNKFGELAANMEKAGFRLLDIEGYDYEGKFVFAGEWVKNEGWQESHYAFDLLPDEFYNKNSMYLNDGYRITEFETYEDNGVVYYAGSWLKGSPVGYKPEATVKPDEQKSSLSLEEFRSTED
ncbi:hypothetical protein [Pelagicoccus albus]|uniref:MORN repeat variant n=1 Tax=Pelagicoccus albus TaxID=415222 RepID=A0A7X1B4U1_9BACT|nr:hypothetical protein [Pelagicoccus albus]MBC2605552.1 hypothetical protein [Pelagicoccus albus]